VSTDKGKLAVMLGRKATAPAVLFREAKQQGGCVTKEMLRYGIYALANFCQGFCFDFS
jgi:hypothetical protein